MLPPVVFRYWVYDTPTVPAGSVAGVDPFAFVMSNSVVTTVTLNTALPVRPFASVAVMVVEEAPGCVGVPTITPLELSRLKPGGSPVLLHVYGAVPPVAWNVMELFPFGGWTYAVPTMNWKLLGVLLLMLITVCTVSVKVAEAVWPAEFVRLTVNVNDCGELAAGSVPLMNPDDDIIRPDGSEPLCKVHV